MTYQNFKQRILELMRQEFGGAAVISIQDVIKNNDTRLDGLTVFSEGCNVSPTIYLNDYYRQCEKGRGFPDIFQEILRIYRENIPESSIDLSFFTAYDKVKTRVVFKLINYERNRDLLSKIPHFRLLDLALVFNYLAKTDHSGIATILIQNSHLPFWNVTRDDLYSLAMENTPRLLRYDLRNMADVLKELFPAEDLPAELSGSLPCPLYVLSNQARLNGSVCILYQDLLRDFAARLGSDLYILPSSVHEVLIVPSEQSGSYEELSQMVREVNATQLSNEEILSDHVYHYSREQDKLTM